MSHLQQRLVVSAIFITVAVFSVYFTTFPYFHASFAFFAAAIVGTSVWELYQITFHKGFQPLDTVGLIGAVTYPFAVFFATQIVDVKMAPPIVLFLILTAVFLHALWKQPDPLLNIAVTLFPFVYLVIPLCTTVTIVHMPEGRWWIIYLIAITKIGDAGAYFIGKKFGRYKLAPRISPKKTWEGVAASFAFAIASSLILAHFVPSIELTTMSAIILAILLTAAAYIGDLSESLLKRDAGVKDSNTLPGLGGVLDMVDSLVFAAPLLYIYLKLR